MHAVGHVIDDNYFGQPAKVVVVDHRRTAGFLAAAGHVALVTLVFTEARTLLFEGPPLGAWMRVRSSPRAARSSFFVRMWAAEASAMPIAISATSAQKASATVRRGRTLAHISVAKPRVGVREGDITPYGWVDPCPASYRPVSFLPFRFPPAARENPTT